MLTTGQTIFLVGMILSIILYRRAEDKHYRAHGGSDDSDIRKYLLNESSLSDSKKPILWIHIPYEYNSRKWESFGSRSSLELNQPYLYLTVKSIIKHCDEDFHICLIDDGTFARIIPDWNIDMSKISDPILKYIRQLALVKLIGYYGGMTVPIEFTCFKNLKELYDKGTRNDTMFVCENVNKNITSSAYDFCPDLRFMGANKNNHMVKMLLDFMQRIISVDNTNESEFLGDFNRWIGAKTKKGHVKLIDGKEVGVKTMEDTIITVDDLLGEDYLSFYDNAFGIWIPAKDILNRTNYEWFARLSPNQVLNARSILSKYMVMSLIPGSTNSIIEPTTFMPDWVDFWKVPATNVPIYGLKPVNLGEYVPKKHA
jgi:hypothetical protein